MNKNDEEHHRLRCQLTLLVIEHQHRIVYILAQKSINFFPFGFDLFLFQNQDERFQVTCLLNSIWIHSYAIFISWWILKAIHWFRLTGQFISQPEKMANLYFFSSETAWRGKTIEQREIISIWITFMLIKSSQRIVVFHLILAHPPRTPPCTRLQYWFRWHNVGRMKTKATNTTMQLFIHIYDGN